MIGTALPRVTFKDVDLDEPRRQLATAAKEKLGYTRLHAVLTPKGLYEVLRKLDIHPLVEKRVYEYMRRKTKTGVYSGTKKFYSVAVGAFVFAIAAVWGICCALEETTVTPGHYTFNTGCVALALLLLGCTIAVGESQKGLGTGSRVVVRWRDTPISRYTGNIPEHILDKAVAIKTASPTAEFTVFYLVKETNERENPLPDPFLEVTIEGQSAFIDVWDEKEYEKSI